MTRRITNEAYLFTPLYEPAKGTPSSPSVDTLTIYRDSGELQLNGKKKERNLPFAVFFFSYCFNKQHLQSRILAFKSNL